VPFIFEAARGKRSKYLGNAEVGWKKRDGSRWVPEQLHSQIRNAHDNKEATGNGPAGNRA